MRYLAIAAAVLAAACGVGSVGGYVADGELEIRSPEPSSYFYRDKLDSFGALVAEVPFELLVGSGIERVVLSDGIEELAELTGPSFSATVGVPRAGNLTITATAYDGAGNALTTTAVNFYSVDPEVSDCYSGLDLYGLSYEKGPSNPGVEDPVTVDTPINGLRHRYVSNEDPRETFYMDCNLALALAKAAPIARKRNVVEVADIGVYNYRCIGGGEPPDCPSGVSMHAYAKAIDIAGYTTADGEFYSVNDDWVIDGEDEDITCAAGTEGPKDAYLHEIICAQKAAGVWNIVLTPNYNSDHRNHFHVDLTSGSDFLRGNFPVDTGPDTH